MTEYNGHMTENTNMMVELLANSAKLKPEEERWHFDKNLDDEMDDNFNNYVTHNDIPMNTNQSENFNAYNNTEKHYSDNNANFNNDTSAPQANNIHQSTNKFIDEEYEILSPLEKRLRRLDMMRALGELRDLGCKVTNYNIDDDYYMMKYELDLHRSIRSKRNWLGLYSHMMIGAIKGIELLNNNYNPFDFSLKGLSDEVNADKNTYYEILGEIYEFHNVPGKKMNPWFRLMVSLIGVVVVVGGKNNAHKFIPGKSKKVENDEDYIEKLRAKAAKDSQSKDSKNSNQEPKNNLDEYMNKQHEHAVQRAKDLEELKRQELEYQQYQQMLAQQKEKFNSIKKNLELTASPSARSETSKRSSAKSVTVSAARKTPVSKASSRSRKDQDTMSQMTTSTAQSTQSTVSQISINKNLAKSLNSQLNRNQGKSKSSGKSIDISIDQISFGSNKKK
jgi:hypothetical protein